jgi:hypothetical protein
MAKCNLVYLLFKYFASYFKIFFKNITKFQRILKHIIFLPLNTVILEFE